MARNRYALDLLRNGITMTNEYNHLRAREEYTEDDIMTIMENARKVEQAARQVLKYKFDLDLAKER